jgi:hypothetical protein
MLAELGAVQACNAVCSSPMPLPFVKGDGADVLRYQFTGVPESASVHLNGPRNE